MIMNNMLNSHHFIMLKLDYHHLTLDNWKTMGGHFLYKYSIHITLLNAYLHVSDQLGNIRINGSTINGQVHH